MKGLPRSLSRGTFQRRQVATKHRIAVNTTVVVTAVGDAIGFGTVVLGSLPEGNVLVQGGLAYLTFAGSGADENLVAAWNGDFGIGTAATADAVLDPADVDLLASTAIGPAVAQVAPQVRATAPVPTIVDNTAGNLNYNLNVLIDAADITDGQAVTLTVTGWVEVLIALLGDD